jgi:DNA-binding response OmpR family regulator
VGIAAHHQANAVLRILLGEEKYQVDTTSNLKDAYDFFKKRQYSLIITEYIPPFETTDYFIQWVKKTLLKRIFSS